jgi:hypothetical protein
MSQFVSHHKTSVQESSCRSLPVIVSIFKVARCRHAYDQYRLSTSVRTTDIILTVFWLSFRGRCCFVLRCSLRCRCSTRSLLDAFCQSSFLRVPEDLTDCFVTEPCSGNVKGTTPVLASKPHLKFCAFTLHAA